MSYYPKERKWSIWFTIVEGDKNVSIRFDDMEVTGGLGKNNLVK